MRNTGKPHFLLTERTPNKERSLHGRVFLKADQKSLNLSSSDSFFFFFYSSSRTESLANMFRAKQFQMIESHKVTIEKRTKKINSF